MTDSLEGAPQGSNSPPRSAHELIPRRAYLTMRIEEIGGCIAAKLEEREALKSDLKALPGKGAPSQKQLRLRRGYVIERLGILKKERAELDAERKAMGPAPKGAGAAQV